MVTNTTDKNVIPLFATTTNSFNNNFDKDYLSECKETLERADYLDVLCGIMDIEYYEKELDEELQDIVDTYFYYYNDTKYDRG